MTGKIAELCKYLKDNLSNSIRCLLDTMLESGELDNIITETVLSELSVFQLKLDGFVNVKEFGAKGDGVTDDTLAIQKAINCEKVKSIYFPSGTYILSSPVTLKSNIKLYGEGTLKAEGSNKTTDMFTINKCENVVIDGLRFETTLNSKDASSFGRDKQKLWSNMIGLHISGSNHISVLNCIFKNFEYALKIDGTVGFNEEILIDNCIVEDSPMPIYISYTEKFRLSNSKLYVVEYASGYDHHIYGSTYCKNHTIENCEFYGGLGVPIHYQDSNESDGVSNIYFAENINIYNVSLINTTGAFIIGRKNSYMNVFNVVVKTSKEYTNGVFRTLKGGKITVNGVSIEAPNHTLVSLLESSDSSIHIFGGIVDVKQIAVNSINDLNEVILKNLKMTIRDRVIVYTTKASKCTIENCDIKLLKDTSTGEPLSIRNENSRMHFINNIVHYIPLDGTSFIYNGDIDKCKDFIFANNIVLGFSTLVHSSANLVKDHNNLKV